MKNNEFMSANINRYKFFEARFNKPEGANNLIMVYRSTETGYESWIAKNSYSEMDEQQFESVTYGLKEITSKEYFLFIVDDRENGGNKGIPWDLNKELDRHVNGQLSYYEKEVPFTHPQVGGVKMLEHRVTKQDSTGTYVWNDAEFTKMRSGDMSLLQKRFHEISRSDFIKGLPRSNNLSVDMLPTTIVESVSRLSKDNQMSY